MEACVINGLVRIEPRQRHQKFEQKTEADQWKRVAVATSEEVARPLCRWFG